MAQLSTLGGMRALQLTQPAGRFRKGLFIVAGICTLALLPVAIYGLLTRSTFAGLILWLGWAMSERGQSRRIACFPFLIGLNLFNQLEEWPVHAHQSMQMKYAILRD